MRLYETGQRPGYIGRCMRTAIRYTAFGYCFYFTLKGPDEKVPIFETAFARVRPYAVSEC